MIVSWVRVSVGFLKEMSSCRNSCTCSYLIYWSIGIYWAHSLSNLHVELLKLLMIQLLSFDSFDSLSLYSPQTLERTNAVCSKPIARYIRPALLMIRYSCRDTDLASRWMPRKNAGMNRLRCDMLHVHIPAKHACRPHRVYAFEFRVLGFRFFGF